MLRFAFPLAPYPCDVLRSIAGSAVGVPWRERERVLREGVAIVAVVRLGSCCVVREESKREQARTYGLHAFQTRDNATACGDGTLH